MDLVDKILAIFVGLTVALTAASVLYPSAASAGDDLNTSGFPLGSLFVGGGVIFILIAAMFIRKTMQATK